MSNRIYDDIIYNETQKNRFLKGLTEQMKNAHLRIFKVSNDLEEQLEKDLYNFNINEASRLMKLLAPSSFASSSFALGLIRSYIQWGIQQDLRDDNINPLASTTTDDFVGSFVDTSKKVYYTEKEIATLIGKIANFQDSASIQAIFEGILGRQYSELLNILKKDLDPHSNVLEIRNKPSKGPLVTRKVNVSDKLMGLLLGAARQEEYAKNNGEGASRYPIIKLVDSPYVFRPAALNSKISDVGVPTLITNRISSIAKLFGQDYLTPTNIRKSGMIKLAYDLIQQTGKFDRQEIIMVCKQFGIDYKITTRIEKEYLNIDTISMLYPEVKQYLK
ncbi:hypothetical protein F4V43_02175 [Paenibacillus spiritus]|uniref:Integrase n=1 Tax=Paenibacillus spiritus TaxID=2496557 RepID=A0A5J5GIJ0_9BACL|nr:hypothetical protein [Paenibacillus spiritus]KAA9007314.1 hypothetical protein F4V43_02175 [Paenibacillus spiritus]